MKKLLILTLTILLASCHQKETIHYSLIDQHENILITGSYTYEIEAIEVSTKSINGHGVDGSSIYIDCGHEVIDGQLKIKVSISEEEIDITKVITVTEKTPKEVEFGGGYKLKLKRTNGST